MTDREKLIDLIIDAKRTDPEDHSFTEYLSDYLLSHGVTIPENHAGETVFALFDVSYCLLKNGNVKERATQIQSLRHLWCAKNTSIVEIREKQCTKTDSGFIGKTVFLTREEAEECLNTHRKEQK